MTIAIDPIVSWPYIAATASVIVALTIWAYLKRLRGTSGRWRLFAFGLRMLAVLLCVLACLRPMVLFQTKSKQASSIAFLIDSSKSMTIADEAGGQSRWTAARRALADGLKSAKGLGPTVVPKSFRFDRAIRDDKPDDKAEPKGDETEVGTALEEVVNRLQGTGRLLAVVLLSDGANNAGRSPSIVAQRLKTQGVPIVAVPFGSETAGAGSKDIAVRAMTAGPTVFVKNELNVSGTVSARGFAGQELEVELLVEGQPVAVDRKKIRVPEKATEVPVTGLKWIPTKAGETKVSLRVAPHPGELLSTNNEFSTFVTVLGGGINALYLAGPYGGWEQRYLHRSLDTSQKAQVTFKALKVPGGPEMDPDFAPGAFDVYILGDLPPDFLTPLQVAALAKRVEGGSGMLMLGGRASFGAGGWAGTAVGDILPTAIGPGDGQNDPEGGLKVIPNTQGLDAYVLKLSRDKSESQRIWADLPNIPGANILGRPKDAAMVWAQTADGRPLMVGLDGPGKGRVMAFAGETWPWARYSEESRLAHLKFWRQAILWLAHKEDDNDSQVRLTLDRRRVAVGGRVELTVAAQDAKGEPISGLKYETIVVRDAKGAQPEKVEVFSQGLEARGTHFVTGEPGDYKVTVTATDDQGSTVGTDSARFLAFQDDRELENPAANLALLRQIAEMTGGQSLPPEELTKYLESMDKTMIADYVTQKEVRVWDNWWFLLTFTAILTMEWWLRKKHGWV